MSAAIWIDRGEPLEWKGAFNWNRHNIFTAFTFMAVKCLTIPPTIHAHLFDDHKDERDTCEQSCVHARTRAPLDIWENIRRIHYKLKSICGYRWLFCRCFSVFHVLFVIVERERSMKREKKANALVLPKCNSFETITGVVTYRRFTSSSGCRASTWMPKVCTTVCACVHLLHSIHACSMAAIALTIDINFI